MQNEEVIFSHNSDNVCHLYLKRKWHIVESLSRVIVNINGVEAAAIVNGEEITIPVTPHSVIELDLQSPSVHNYYRVEISQLPRIEFGFSFFGTKGHFKYNNIKIHTHSGCTITEKGTELSNRQKLDNKFSIIAIIICLLFYIGLQLSRCNCRIIW